jgi:hypothetical protein
LCLSDLALLGRFHIGGSTTAIANAIYNIIFYHRLPPRDIVVDGFDDFLGLQE